MIRFISPKYSNLHQPLRKGLSVDFVNGKFETDDEALIHELRELIIIQLQGGLQTIQESIDSESTRVSGIIHLELIGVPNYKLYVNNDSLADVMERIKEVTQIGISQSNPNRLDEITPIKRGSIKVDDLHSPDFNFGNATGYTNAAALPTATTAQSVVNTPTVKKANPVRPVAAKKLRAKKGEKVNA